jgi:hypothetical protein
MDEAMLLREYLGKRKPFDEVYSLLKQPKREPAAMTRIGGEVEKGQREAIEMTDVSSQIAAERAKEAQAAQDLLSREQLKFVADRMQNRGTISPNKELMSELDRIKTERSQVEPSRRDMWAEAIISLGPALLGGLSGSAGMKAALPAQQTARGLYEGMRKEGNEATKLKIDALNKREAAIRELMKSDLGIQDKENIAARAYDKLYVDAMAAASQAEGKMKEALEKQAHEYKKMADDARFKSPKDVADIDLKAMQESRQKEEGKMKSPGKEAESREFGKTWGEFSKQGGYQDFQNSYSTLSGVMAWLRKGGDNRYLNLLPDKVRDVIAPEGRLNQALVHDAIIAQIRPMLGAQFTQKEKEDFLDMKYNPTIPIEKRIRQLGTMLKRVKDRNSALIEAGEYFDKHGNFEGFNPKLREQFNVLMSETGLKQKLPQQSNDGLKAKRNKLKEIYDSGQISKEMYDKKLKELGGK